MEWWELIMDVLICKSKYVVLVLCMRLCNKDWWNGIEECVFCDKELLLNGRELKLGDSHSVASGNSGK